MTKILVVGPSWIGDTVLAQPLFKLLHTRYDSPVVDVLAPGWTVPILERMPEVRRAIENPVGHGELRLAEQKRLAREIAQEHYEHAIVLPNSFKSALVPFLARIPLRTGYLGELRWGLLTDARRVDRERQPQIAQRYAALAFARGEALEDPLPAPALRVDETQRCATLPRLGLPLQRPAAALCPGAEYGPAKRWPARHFAMLARELAIRDYAVWLIGGPGDAAIGEEIERLSQGASANLCGRTTLAEAIDVLASTHVVVSNDSGLMHVAAALGKPLVALYGSSSPAFTPPLSPRARILTLNLPCSPCFKRECPLGHFKCMIDLSPEHVLGAIASIGDSRPHGARVHSMVDKKSGRH
jgi:lipopolysaccharide heptosyltransferase II